MLINIAGARGPMSCNQIGSVMAIEDLIDDFELLEDWEEKYRYVIELGKNLPELPDAYRTASNKVRGCASQVWLHTSLVTDGPVPTLQFQGDSDAHIVRGLVAILFEVYSGRSAQEILDTDAVDVFRKIGLHEHLTPQRSNGFASMVKRIQLDAHSALNEAPADG